MDSLSIIVPCFNEETTISVTIEKVVSYIKALPGINSWELIIVDDGSTDATASIVRKYSDVNPGVKLEGYHPNHGRGFAIKYGIRKSKGDIIILLDADLSYDVEHVGEILNQFNSAPNLDIVVVSPYMKGGLVRGVPFFRLLLSRVANWVLASFFSDKLSTVTCVVRGYRGDLIRSLPLYEDGKELHVEILRALDIINAKIIEIPGRLVWKTKQRRKVSMKVLSSARDHFIYALLMRPARYLVRLASVLLFVGLYEGFMMGRLVLQNYSEVGEGWGRTLWKALSLSFSHSPHTAVIAITAIILSIQLLSFAAIVQIMKIHQDEKMRHLIGLYRKG